MSEKTDPEQVSKEEEVPKEVDFDELSEIDKIFRDKYEAILGDIAKVLENYEIKGYRITDLTFKPPNPRLCLPYVRYVPDVGVVCGVSCFDV